LPETGASPVPIRTLGRLELPYVEPQIRTNAAEMIKALGQ